MRRNRYLLCLLLCVAMLYFALPNLSPTEPGAAGVFAIAWLIFAFLVLAGNLTALLFNHNYGNTPSKEQGRNLKKGRIRARS
ncbi:hypothetical protein MUB24_02180 [Lederbergia sp. NSJ-179]|uniref:hypothetical protein n=1 Tax=Lederbergia sp. NSJ-179 TaxID=2931402 RepID=UPI001FD2B80D|nr:hypothetical protein [Lederbergia sp. NSJ-179]MCJ7839735.1 hypothetical protein [Lederbergia sp. NSJ-179]